MSSSTDIKSSTYPNIYQYVCDILVPNKKYYKNEYLLSLTHSLVHDLQQNISYVPFFKNNDCIEQFLYGYLQVPISLCTNDEFFKYDIYMLFCKQCKVDSFIKAVKEDLGINLLDSLEYAKKVCSKSTKLIK